MNTIRNTHMPTPDDFHDLMDRWEDQFEQGTELSPEELCKDRPEFLEEARKYIRAIKAVGGGAAARNEAVTVDAAVTRDTADYKATQPVPSSAKATHFPDIAGYELLGELGRGGMGLVYKARQRSLNRVVALKMILRGDRTGPSDLARFQREAEALGQLQHPNIVQVFDVGESEGRPYFALEYVEGGSLNRKLGGQPLPPREAAELVGTLARAVHFAHERGFIHRDLKPGNILVTVTGEPKITDFGLVKRWDSSGDTPADGPTMTISGEVLGTPAYMAPEQARGDSRDTGPAADVYALGAILYELITGRLPFRGATLVDVLDKVRNSLPTQPGRIRQGIPRDLETICLKCLEKDPAKRYLSAAVLAEDLQRFLHGEPILARPVTTLDRFWRWCRRNPYLAATSAAALLALFATAVVSTVFAIESNRSRKAVESALGTSERHRMEAARRLAETTFDRGLGMCEQGDVAGGAWWMARALGYAGEHDDLKQLIEANLTGWVDRLCSLERVIEHPGPVTAASVGAGGRLLATAVENDPRVRVWPLDGGPAPAAPLQDSGPVYSIALHPREPVLAAGGAGNRVLVWDLRTPGAAPRVLPHDSPVTLLRASNDGRWLATGAGTQVRLWDTTANFAAGDPLDHPFGVRDIAFLGDGPGLATAAPLLREVRFWTGKGVKPEPRLLQTNDGILALAASPDGRLLATGGFGELPTLVQRATLQPLPPISGAPDNVQALAFHPKSSVLLIGNMSGTARLWDAHNRRPYGSPMVHARSLTAAVFSPDGLRVVTTSYDRTARVWRLPAEPESRLFQHEAAVTSATASRDGRRIAALRADKKVSLWDTGTGQAVCEPVALPAVPTVARFDHTGSRVVLLCNQNTVRVWEPDSGKLTDFGPAHEAIVTAAAFTPDGGRLVTGAADGVIRVWEWPSGRSLGSPLRHPEPVAFLAVNPQGTRLLAWGSSSQEDRARTATLWDLATGGRAAVLDHAKTVQAAAFGPDGRVLATGDRSGAIRLWDANTGAVLGKLDGHAAGVGGLAFHPGGEVLASASEDRTVRLWKVATRESVGAMRHPRYVTGVAFNPDGNTLLTHSAIEGLSRLWDVPTLRQLGPARGHSRTAFGFSVGAAFFSPDGRSFFTAGDTTVRAFPVPASSGRGKEAWERELRSLTGQELDAGGAFTVLDSAAWGRAAVPTPAEK